MKKNALVQQDDALYCRGHGCPGPRSVLTVTGTKEPPVRCTRSTRVPETNGPAAPAENPAGWRDRGGRGGRARRADGAWRWRRAGELDMEGRQSIRGRGPGCPCPSTDSSAGKWGTVAGSGPEGGTQAGGEPALRTHGPAAPSAASSVSQRSASGAPRSCVKDDPRCRRKTSHDWVQVHK